MTSKCAQLTNVLHGGLGPQKTTEQEPFDMIFLES